MELREALTQIAEIRQQMARGQIFRGYRAATTAFSGLAAVAAAFLQASMTSGGASADGQSFVVLWVAAAGVSLAVVGSEMAIRSRRWASQVQRQLTLLAVEQFTPSIVAGGLLAWVFWDYMPAENWMLPGLWMILFALGVFASARLLPREVFGVAAFYLLAGIWALIISHDPASGWRLSPWLMGGTFGIGQMAMAGILYYKLERRHE